MAQTYEQYNRLFANLKTTWSSRKQKFTTSYDLLAQKDTEKVEGLESFVSNNPRTAYNMALFLLTPQVVPYTIPVNNADTTTQDAIGNVEAFIEKQWAKLDKQAYRNGWGGSWLYYFNSLLLATGWYAVMAYAQGVGDNADFIADIWNGADVFPDIDDGLSAVLHSYRISASGARKKIANSVGWNPVKITQETDVEINDYWYYNDDGKVCNCIIIGNTIAKDEVIEIDEIPVFCSPVGGLPDRGSINTDGNSSDGWRANMGQSIIGTNERTYKAYNRQTTFVQQIVRDTAQPRIVERTKSKGVVTRDNWDKRGAIFHLDIDEDIHTLQMPGLPPEASTLIQNTSDELQRGAFAHSLYTGGEASGYAQSLTTAAAQQVLKTFKDNRDFLLSAVCNMWLKCLRMGIVKPNGFSFPTAFPNDAEFDMDIPISVPGDLIQRATTARQLNPNYRISNPTTSRLLFPEIKDVNNEIVLARTDLAMQAPEVAELDLVSALLDAADALKVEGRTRQSGLYTTLANSIQARLMGQQQPQQAQQATPPGPPGQDNAGRQ